MGQNTTAQTFGKVVRCDQSIGKTLFARLEGEGNSDALFARTHTNPSQASSRNKSSRSMGWASSTRGRRRRRGRARHLRNLARIPNAAGCSITR